MLTWILGITCAVLFIIVVVLLLTRVSSKKTMVGAVVAALGVGASTGQLPDTGPKFIVDKGITTKTVYMELKDQGKERPAHDIIIKRPLETGQTMTMAVWYDTVLVGDLVYKKTVENDSDKVTECNFSVVVNDARKK